MNSPGWRGGWVTLSPAALPGVESNQEETTLKGSNNNHVGRGFPATVEPLQGWD